MLILFFTLFIFLVMLFIAAIHIYWLKGGLWPGKNYQELVDKVLGTGDRLPSTWMFVVVIVVFLLMAAFPVLVYFNINFTGYEKEILLLFSIVFFIRSFYMLLPPIANKVTKEFFALNKRVYAPICLALGMAYLYLYLVG